MKFSHEYPDQIRAEARESALKASGYTAWRHQKADGHWQVFWMIR